MSEEGNTGPSMGRLEAPLDRRKIARSAVAMSLPVFAIAAAVTTTILSVSGNAEMLAYRSEERYTVAIQASNLGSDIRHVSSDLVSLANQNEVRAFWDDDGNFIPGVLTALAREYYDISVYRQLYDQVRLIDEHGMEAVRVNFNDGHPAVVPQEELQNKQDRYYFADAFRLNRGEVYVSPLDLNIELGEIELPLKPMIRFATPVFGRRGERRGIVLLNYFGAILLERFAIQANTPRGSQAMLLNADGYWLHGLNTEVEWGFMFEDRGAQTFAVAFPEAWERVRSEQSCQFETPQGLFTSETVYPLLEGQKSSTGAGEAFAPSQAQLETRDYYWKVVSFVPSEVLYAARNSRRMVAASILAVLALTMVTGAWRLAGAAALRKQSEEEQKRLLHETGERVKELGCLFGVTESIRKRETLEEIFRDVAALLPLGWHYPDVACGRVRFNGGDYVSEPFEETEWKQSCDIVVNGERRGVVEVFYLEERPELDDGPFMSEERRLIDGIVRTLGEAIERRQAEEELRKAHNDLELRIQERTEELARANRLAQAANEVLQEALTCESAEAVAQTCLAAAEELTGSRFGLIGEVNEAGRFDTIALSNPGWDACTIPESDAAVLISDMEIRGIWGTVIKDGQSRIVNDPASHPEGIGVPEGHPPLTAFLGIPLKQEGKTFGMIALANKEGGYEPRDREAVEALSVAFVESLMHKRAELSLRDARAELIRKERLAVLGQLSGSVSHELRNPLGVISNAVYYLNNVLPDADETTKEYLGIISSEVHTADKIVSDLLDLSRTRPAERTETAVTELVAQVLARQPVPENIEVVTEIATDLPPLLVDPGQIGLVLANLVTNAIQAMPEGGELALSARSGESTVTLSVSDTGCGISEDTMAKLFEPLFTTKSRGIGLGLSVSKNLVEVNGGAIEVESEVGKGATFTVELPTRKMQEGFSP